MKLTGKDVGFIDVVIALLTLVWHKLTGYVPPAPALVPHPDKDLLAFFDVLETTIATGFRQDDIVFFVPNTVSFVACSFLGLPALLALANSSIEGFYAGLYLIFEYGWTLCEHAFFEITYLTAHTIPYNCTYCRWKSVMLFIIVETAITYSFLKYTLRFKKASLVYLAAKIWTVYVPVFMVTEGDVLYYVDSEHKVLFYWIALIGATVTELILVNAFIVGRAWGNPKGYKLHMRVTDRRKLSESCRAFIYNSVKFFILTGTLCSWTRETRRWGAEYNLWSISPFNPINEPDLGLRASQERVDRFLDRSERFPWNPVSDYYTALNLDLLYKLQMKMPYVKEVQNFFLPRKIFKWPWLIIKNPTPTYTHYDYVKDLVKYLPPERQARIRFHSGSNGLSPDYTYLATFSEIDSVSNIRYGILFILALSSLTVYSIILAGWSSNSKYAFLGALRSAAQMISYEVSISLALLPVILLSGSLNLTEIVYAQINTIWYILPLLPVALIFLVSMLAETNRTPFDLPEAEAELVAGYNVDYSSLPFAMFFLGEYANMILISVFFCILFLGGWDLFGLETLSPFVLAFKAAIPWVFFVLVRATLPRYRYDQLMDIGWKSFLPVTGAFLVLVIGLVVFLDVAPVVEEIPYVSVLLFTPVFLNQKSTTVSLAKNSIVPLTFLNQSQSTVTITLNGYEQLVSHQVASHVQHLPAWLVVTSLLFICGLFGMVYNYKNFLVTIMCVEVMYLGAVTSFVLYGLAFRDASAAVFGLLVLIFGACESAVGLGLLVAVYRFDHKIAFAHFNNLGG